MSNQKALIAQALVTFLCPGSDSPCGSPTNRSQKSEQSLSTAVSPNRALEAAIDAAEHYMKALRLATVPKDRQSLDTKCKELLTRAEKIKKSKDAQPAGAGDRNLTRREPVSSRKLTTREEIILLEGAKLHGFIFPPWTCAPDPEEFEMKNEGELFTYVMDSG